MLQSMGSQRVIHDWETEQEKSQEYFFFQKLFLRIMNKRHTDAKYRVST